VLVYCWRLEQIECSRHHRAEPIFLNVFRAPRNRFRQTGNRFLGFLKGKQIRVLGSSKLSFNQTEVKEVLSMKKIHHSTFTSTRLDFLAAVAPVV
jgi:hypothetical protein